MKAIYLLGLLVVVNIGVFAYYRAASVLSFPKEVNVGEVFQEDHERFTIRADYSGMGRLAIHAVQPGCSCIDVKEIVAHGDSAEITLVVSPLGKSAGRYQSSVLIKTNDAKRPMAEVLVVYHVKTRLQIAPNRVEILTPIGHKQAGLPIQFRGSIDITSDTDLSKLALVGFDDLVGGDIREIAKNKAKLELSITLPNTVDEFERRLFVKTGQAEVPLDILAIRR